MRSAYRVVVLAWLPWLGLSGCAHTRDISSTPEYAPWIGKTVKLRESGAYNVMAPKWSDYYLQATCVITDCPVAGRVAEDAMVVIEAVKETKGTYLIGGPYTQVHLVLSMEHPVEKNKRIRVSSELADVEPFRDRVGCTLDFIGNLRQVNVPATYIQAGPVDAVLKKGP